jgi:hypothetical protein
MPTRRVPPFTFMNPATGDFVDLVRREDPNSMEAIEVLLSTGTQEAAAEFLDDRNAIHTDSQSSASVGQVSPERRTRAKAAKAIQEACES